MATTEKQIKKLLRYELRRQKVTLWGSSEIFTPVMVSKIWGDGLQVIYLKSIDQRPKFWIARIDSKTDINEGFDIEEIVSEIEEEYGRVPETGYLTHVEFKEMRKNGRLSDYDGLTYSDYKDDCKYPRMDWGGGFWGTIENFGAVGEKSLKFSSAN